MDCGATLEGMFETSRKNLPRAAATAFDPKTSRPLTRRAGAVEVGGLMSWLSSL